MSQYAKIAARKPKTTPDFEASTKLTASIIPPSKFASGKSG
jgi:hypothetical protein